MEQAKIAIVSVGALNAATRLAVAPLLVTAIYVEDGESLEVRLALLLLSLHEQAGGHYRVLGGAKGVDRVFEGRLR